MLVFNVPETNCGCIMLVVFEAVKQTDQLASRTTKGHTKKD